MKQKHADKQIELWFADEAREGMQGRLTHIWARKGSRPSMVKQTGYTNLHVITAVCPETGEADGLLCECLDGQTMQAYLNQLSRRISEDKHCVLVWDGAGWHVWKQLVVPANITIVKLPPYCPQLNPVENLWAYMRERHWSNGAYEDKDDLWTTVGETWREVCLDKERIKSVCAADHILAS